MEPIRFTAAGQPGTGWRAGPSDAPAVVLLHGVPTSAALWSRLPPLLTGRRLIALDLPGHGETPPLPVPDLPSHTRWLADALAALAISGEVHLVGQDYGGLIAALHAAACGAASLTLTSCPTGLLWLLPRLTATPPLHRYFYERHSGGLYLQHGICPASRAAFLARFAAATEQAGLSEQMRQTALNLSGRTLLRLSGRLTRVPTLCLWGREDRFNPPITARWTARRLGGRCVLIDGGRHYVPFGQPEAYAAALHQFWGRDTLSRADP